MPALRAEVRLRRDVGPDDVASMYALYETYFEATNPAIFEEDLVNKQYVILLLDEQGGIQGFSTLAVLRFDQGRALFSGDTIVRHLHWGEQTLPTAWCRLAGRIRAECPREPLYWLLISKGYRTYRYLPLFSKQYYPSWREPTPPEVQRLMDALALKKFGDCYDPRSGVVRFPQSRGQLRGLWADVRPELRSKPDVLFFLQRNPGYRNGDELVCLTELAPENLRSFARRAFIEAL